MPNPYCLPDHTTFAFNKIDELYVQRLIDKLNTNKATGIDGIPTKLVKIAAPAISNPLTKLINASFEQGLFPDRLKIAKVKPLFKKGSAKLMSNYRPISILPVFSKIFEQIANSQIMTYLENHSILTPKQYGFRKNMSTSQALSILTNKVLAAMDVGKVILGIFLNLSKIRSI